jgi:tetratricopeptide (TPR) repeat protein
MSKTLWQNLVTYECILRQENLADNSLVLWLPGFCEGSYQHWERLHIVGHSQTSLERDIRVVAASLNPARQKQQRWFDRLLAGLSRSNRGTCWELPNGTVAVPSGECESDVVVVWSEDHASPPDEAWLRSHWPQCQRVQRLGSQAFFVTGVEALTGISDEEPLPPQGCPHQKIEQLLATARRQGNRLAEVSALTDWGLVLIREGKFAEASARLEAALKLVRQIGNHSLESDVLNYVGLALLNRDQPQQALDILEKALAYARSTGNRFAEKAALFHLGLGSISMLDWPKALKVFDECLTLSGIMGDRKHMTELLWYMAIVHAELGQRDLAMAKGQEVVTLLKGKRDPQAAWFAHHLENYEVSIAEAGQGIISHSEGPLGTAGYLPRSVESKSSHASTSVAQPHEVPLGKPGLLRMAFSSVTAITRFIGSGLKTVPRSAYEKRLAICETCEHFTGVRCRVCGCFANVKASMFYEECPIGKWPSIANISHAEKRYEVNSR